MKVAERISSWIRERVEEAGAEGVVLGMSGGIDSSVVAALCVKSLGPGKVLGVLMPERDSSPDSKDLALELADAFGFETVIEDMTAGLEGMGCYRHRDEAIKQVFPEFDAGYKSKITIAGNILKKDSDNFF